MEGPDILIADTHFLSKICRGGILRDTMKDIRKKKPRRIIIDGDLYHRPPSTKAHYFEKRMRKHPKQAEGLLTLQAMEYEDGIEMITIPANHDPNLALIRHYHPRFVFGEVVEEYRWERNGVLYYATHGHQGDTNLDYPFAKFFLNAHDFIQWLDREDTHVSRKIERMFTRRMWEERLITTPRWVMNRARELGAHHAFWGHTHVPVSKIVVDGVIGHGIGSFCEHPASYFEVTDDGPKLCIVG